MNALTIVIVNYRTADLAVHCLRSIEPDAAATDGLHVIVVDNASGDRSVERLRAAIGDNGWSDWTTLIASPRNGGFSAGNNIGISARRSGLYMLLNPDTIVKPGAIPALIDFMNEHPRAGIVGSELEDEDGRRHSTARRCLSPLSEFEAGARTNAVSKWLGRVEARSGGQAPVQCDWVSGAAMCVRREVFDEIGLLDEGYFLYFEELDLCERARSAPSRWEVWSLPRSRILHHEGASTGIDDPSRTRPAYWYESRRRFFLKRHGVIGLILADAAWCAGRSLLAVRRSAGMARHAINVPAARAAHLIWGDARSIVNGEAFRIARGGLQV